MPHYLKIKTHPTLLRFLPFGKPFKSSGAAAPLLQCVCPVLLLKELDKCALFFTIDS